MKLRHLLLLTTIALPAAAADYGKITSVQKDRFGNVTEITETVADANGNIQFESYGVGASAMSSADEAGGTQPVQSKMIRGTMRDRVVYRADTDTVYAIERGQCQTMNANSMPGGVSADGMAEYQGQMAAAQAEIAKAMADNPELAAMMKNNPNLLGGMNPMQQRDTLKAMKSGNGQKIGRFDTEEFVVVGERSGTEKQRVWAAKVGDVKNGQLVYDGMINMFTVFDALAANMGARGLGNDSLSTAIMRDMKGYYPIRIVDSANGEITEVISDEGQGSTDFSVECAN